MLRHVIKTRPILVFLGGTDANMKVLPGRLEKLPEGYHQPIKIELKGDLLILTFSNPDLFYVVRDRYRHGLYLFDGGDAKNLR